MEAEEATWLIQAIDPLTGELLQDTSRGLLPPNNARGDGAGFVSYTVLPEDDVPTGTTIQAQARVLLNTAPPEDTPQLVQTIDGQAPASSVQVQPILGSDNSFEVTWNATDDPRGSGLKHVTVYVAVDGGDFRIWQRQDPHATATELYEGQTGRTYEFLTMATDIAGNREAPPFGANAADDGSGANLGSVPTVPATTPPNFGIPPTPQPQSSTNPLFDRVAETIPAAEAPGQATEFDTVFRPFVAHAFAT